MTCKDCLSYDTCLHRIMQPDEGKDQLSEHGCKHFKNKADFMEVAEMTNKIDFAIEATNKNSDYDVGLRNGLRLALSFIDGKQPEYERSDM